MSDTEARVLNNIPSTTPSDEKPSTSELILDAAERVVARDGASLTIDAVVKESGFSKGGVLYNFPSKKALIEGMIQRMTDRFLERHETAKAQAFAEKAPLLPALISAFFDDKHVDRQVHMGLLAALAESPELIEPIRRVHQQIREDMLTYASDPYVARIVMLAADGLHFSEILGLETCSPDERGAIEARLIALVTESPQ
ncbi:TetR/AcrR family transcriptional regulator [Oceanicaulis sp. UBA2681]|uniref:TetR/AcrR family transcriptional regulator n=1 Tax=Oceanicaulis sp. UBA2681 TaxID=1947007 RepID=UPI002353A477|nr:TetR/AcrR family transcriptional regulator [Oceanicaulis sp. UBA2681]